MQMLGVSAQTLDDFGAVSEETAREMAEGALRAAGTTFAVSVTGIAGPSMGAALGPHGTGTSAPVNGLCAVSKPWDNEVRISKAAADGAGSS